MTQPRAADAAVQARVEAVLDRLRRVNLQVMVVARPDATHLAARDRARVVAAEAGRAAIFDEAATAAREATLRSFASAGFSGTWAATEMSASVASASDRIAAAAAFEEAAMAAVVEDLADDDTLDVLRATAEELSRSSTIPVPGSLAGFTAQPGLAADRPRDAVIVGVLLLLCAVAWAALGPAFALLLFAVGALVLARLTRPRPGSDA